MATEWVLVAERETGVRIVRDGFKTEREAAVVRREMERQMDDDDTTNLLVLTRRHAVKMA